MAGDWQAFPSAFSNGINSLSDTVVDPVESIGTTGDAVASGNNSVNSAFSLAKGMCDGLGVAAGSGAGDVNDNAKVYADPLETLGGMGDAPAADTGSHSAISLLKGILAQAGI